MPRQLPLMSRRLAFALVVMLLAAAAQARAQARAQTPAADATFTRDIAPILIDKCGTCHRPDGPGPFSLLTYADARARARLIADVTRSGYMPPWKPEPGHGALVGERRLTKEEIERIGRWVEGGARQGDPAAMPKLPHWPAGWQSGEPDLVLTLPEYEVPASRESVLNVFRNFAVAVPDIGTRHVRALEFRPGSSSVHHANIFVDRTTTSRRLDDDDPLPGYKGLIPHTAVFPEGHFLGWTPGQAPPLQQDAPTWRLEGGDNLLVQLHIEPTGKTERLKPTIGLYFAATPSPRTATMLRLGRQSIDIAPGNAEYVTTDSFVLPVDAHLLALQPHAHYRARTVRAWAELPGGEQRALLSIRSWDFRWQDQYRYVEPVFLPAGTRLHLRFVHDNSSGNPSNPDVPAKRVQWGFRSVDEMGDLWVQLMTRDENDRRVLTRDVSRKMSEEGIVGLEVQIAVTPDYKALRNDIALLYLELGRPAQAVAHFERVAQLEPASAAAHLNVGTALETAGDAVGAAVRYQEALRLDPNYAKAHYALGASLNRAGRFAEAMAPLERAIALDPQQPDAYYYLARASSAVNRPADAVRLLSRAVEIRPEWPEALAQLAWLLATEGDASVQNPAKAVQYGLRAAALTNHRDSSVLDSLAAAYAAAGRFDLATVTAEAALSASAPSDAPELAQQVRARLALYRAGRPVVVRR